MSGGGQNGLEGASKLKLGSNHGLAQLKPIVARLTEIDLTP